jgi:hypothetical protein
MSDIVFKPEHCGPFEDVTFDQIKEQIDGLIFHWLGIYNQQHRDVRRNWIGGPGADAANCEFDSEYDEVVFGFNPGRIISEMDEEELDETVCHEVAHIPTWPLWKFGERLIKRLSQLGLDADELNNLRDDLKEAGEYSTVQVHRAVMRAYNAKDDSDRSDTDIEA